MKLADFKLLIAAIVFLFLNILILLVYYGLLQVQPSSDHSIDVLFVAKGRQRAHIQHQLWQQNWHSINQTRFLVLHLEGIDDFDDTTDELIHIQTPYSLEQDVFIHISELIPEQERSPSFLWASDQVVPIRNVSPSIFRRNNNGMRFFNGFEPDAILFNAQKLYEFTLPFGLMFYHKSLFTNYDQFAVRFISGQHHLYTHMAQKLVLPNPKNKAKRLLSHELFQVAHISPDSDKKMELNENVKQIWRNYLRSH